MEKGKYDMSSMTSLGSAIKNSRDNCTIVVNKVNPIVTIVDPNSTMIVDKLLEDCSDLMVYKFRPYFAREFYHLDASSVLAGASLARQDGKDKARFFSNLVHKAKAK